MLHIRRGYSLVDPIDAAMFEERRRLFVDLMGWSVPVVAGRFEIDQFDGNHATYVIDADDDGFVAGSLRLLPTVRPHILGSLFAGLCQGAVPADPDTAEITRLCMPSRIGAPARLRVRNRLISAMVDHALATGLRSLTGVVRPRFREQILMMGWDAEPLGPVRLVDGIPLAAFRIFVDANTPDLLATTGIYVETASVTMAPSLSPAYA